MKALLIPVEGPIEEIELDGTLDQLQTLVGGYIEAVPLPGFLPSADAATAYVNEEGKFLPTTETYLGGFNGRATDFMVPGVGLFAGDFIAGPFLLCGFDPYKGEHAELPNDVIDRARLIEREAA
jgi:hypothetical protein